MNMGTIPTFRSSQTYKKEIPRGFKFSATFLFIRKALTLPLIVVCVCGWTKSRWKFFPLISNS